MIRGRRAALEVVFLAQIHTQKNTSKKVNNELRGREQLDVLWSNRLNYNYMIYNVYTWLAIQV